MLATGSARGGSEESCSTPSCSPSCSSSAVSGEEIANAWMGQVSSFVCHASNRLSASDDAAASRAPRAEGNSNGIQSPFTPSPKTTGKELVDAEEAASRCIAQNSSDCQSESASDVGSGCQSPLVVLSPSPSPSRGKSENANDQQVENALRESEEAALAAWRPYSLASDFPWFDKAASYRTAAADEDARGEEAEDDEEEEAGPCASLAALRSPPFEGLNGKLGLLVFAAAEPKLVADSRLLASRLSTALEGRPCRKPADPVEQKAEAAAIKLWEVLNSPEENNPPKEDFLSQPKEAAEGEGGESGVCVEEDSLLSLCAAQTSLSLQESLDEGRLAPPSADDERRSEAIQKSLQRSASWLFDCADALADCPPASCPNANALVKKKHEQVLAELTKVAAAAGPSPSLLADASEISTRFKRPFLQHPVEGAETARRRRSASWRLGFSDGEAASDSLLFECAAEKREEEGRSLVLRDSALLSQTAERFLSFSEPSSPSPFSGALGDEEDAKEKEEEMQLEVEESGSGAETSQGRSLRASDLELFWKMPTPLPEDAVTRRRLRLRLSRHLQTQRLQRRLRWKRRLQVLRRIKDAACQSGEASLRLEPAEQEELRRLQRREAKLQRQIAREKTGDDESRPPPKSSEEEVPNLTLPEPVTAPWLPFSSSLGPERFSEIAQPSELRLPDWPTQPLSETNGDGDGAMGGLNGSFAEEALRMQETQLQVLAEIQEAQRRLQEAQAAAAELISVGHLVGKMPLPEESAVSNSLAPQGRSLDASQALHL